MDNSTLKQVPRHLRLTQILLDAIGKLTGQLATDEGGDEAIQADALVRLVQGDNRAMLAQRRQSLMGFCREGAEHEEAAADLPPPK